MRAKRSHFWEVFSEAQAKERECDSALKILLDGLAGPCAELSARDQELEAVRTTRRNYQALGSELSGLIEQQHHVFDQLQKLLIEAEPPLPPPMDPPPAWLINDSVSGKLFGEVIDVDAAPAPVKDGRSDPVAESAAAPAEAGNNEAPATPPRAADPDDDIPLLEWAGTPRTRKRLRLKRKRAGQEPPVPKGSRKRQSDIASRARVLPQYLSGSISLEEAALQLDVQQETVRKMKLSKVLAAAAAIRSEGKAFVGRTATNKSIARKVALGGGSKKALPKLRAAMSKALVRAILLERKRVPLHVAYKTMKKCSQEVYPDGAANAEVKQYLQQYFHKLYKRDRMGIEQKCKSRRIISPGKLILKSILKDLAFSVKNTTSMRQRHDSIDDTTIWPKAVQTFRDIKHKFGIPLANCKDSDEQCLFFEGNMGWKMFSRCIGQVNESLSCKARRSYRKCCSTNFGTTAAGEIFGVCVLGKQCDFGKEGEGCPKLKKIRATPIAGTRANSNADRMFVND